MEENKIAEKENVNQKQNEVKIDSDNLQKRNKTKKIIILIIGALLACVATASVIMWIWYATQPVMSAKVEYIVGEKSIEAYEVPAVPAKAEVPPTYRSQDPVTLYVGDPEIDENNDGKSDFPYLTVGIDIDKGKYEITDLQLDKYCSLYKHPAGYSNRFGGDQYYKDDVINLEEGDVLAAFNCSRLNTLKTVLTPIGEKEIIDEGSPAVPEVPAYMVTENYFYVEPLEKYSDFDEYTWCNESAGNKNTAVTDCTKLKQFDLLTKGSSDKVKKSEKNMTEEYLYYTRSDKVECKINGVKEACSDLRYFDRLKEKALTSGE